jgi:transglutaminase superfamily protein
MWYLSVVQHTAQPTPMSPAFLRRVKRYQADLLDNDKATAQTVELMAERARVSARDPLVRRAAHSAVEQWRGGPLYGMTGRDPWSDPQALAESCWWFAKTHIKFVHHNELIAIWFNERDQLQLIISPEIMLTMRRMKGDCAIFTTLICALLEALGLPWEIVTAAVDPRQPDVFSHVWPRVVLPSGRRVPLDASHGAYPGWQVPTERQYKVQVWNEDGWPIANAQPGDGLTGYRMRGMGDVCFPGDPDYNPSLCGGLTPVPSVDTNPSVNLNTLYPAYSQAASSGSGAGQPGFNTAGFLANLANQWTQIGSRVLAPSTTYQRNADGSYSVVIPGSNPSAIPTSGIGGSSMLWIGGALLGGVVLISLAGKK